MTLSKGGTATDGADYTLNNTITISVGLLSASTTLAVINDLNAELDETVVITITCGVTCTVGSPSQQTVLIISDDLPVAPANFQVTFDVNQLLFSWSAVSGAASYQIWEDLNNTGTFSQVGTNIVALNTSFQIAVHTHNWPNARYKVKACNSQGACGPDSTMANTIGKSADATGYVKASNIEAGDQFGYAVAVSGDGLTMAIGAPYEDSATQLSQSNNTATSSGAVYLFRKNGSGNWSQEAYLKASLPGAGDLFGFSVSLSDDGNTLAVGAPYEASSATSTIIASPNGTSAAEQNNTAPAAGAIYLFTRSETTWSTAAYMKASNAQSNDLFGTAVALSGDRLYLAVSAPGEASSAVNTIIVNPNNSSPEENNNASLGSGAVYIFAFDSTSNLWNRNAYVKMIVIGAGNTSTDDDFGAALFLDQTGSMLAVGAPYEDGSATGVNAPTNEGASDAGAVHTYTRSSSTWTIDDYIKASNTGSGDFFGSSVALSNDGLTLAVGAPYEKSNATGVFHNPNGTSTAETNNSAREAGAVYLYTRNVTTATWETKAYVKASNTPTNNAGKDQFGTSVSLNQDGNMLAVGAPYEDGSAIGVNGSSNELSANAGAAYTFTLNSGVWSQNGYIKASNTGTGDGFGFSTVLSDHSGLSPDNMNSRLVIGAPFENSSITSGVSKGSDPTNDAAASSGAAYLY
jgi:hypothetical protein